MERREAIKHLFAGASGGALLAGPALAEAVIPEGAMILPPNPELDRGYPLPGPVKASQTPQLSDLDAAALEIQAYHRRAVAALRAAYGLELQLATPWAVNATAAAVLVRRYLRGPAVAVAPPQIDGLIGELLTDYDGQRRVLQQLFRRLVTLAGRDPQSSFGPWSPNVPEATASDWRFPDVGEVRWTKVVTPRFLLDVDDLRSGQTGPEAVAWCLMQSATSILTEMRRVIDEALAACPAKGRRVDFHYQDVCAFSKVEGYLWEGFAYVSLAGTVTPADHAPSVAVFKSFSPEAKP